MAPHRVPLFMHKRSPKASLVFRECVPVLLRKEPVAAEQPWALDLKSFGLAR